MTAKYFALLTQVGAAKLANATALGTPLAITDMVVGDANGTDPTPDPTQTALVHECHRAPLNSLRVDPDNTNQVIAEQVLAETVGGWWVREIGLVDADGDLIAVGNCPPSYKPQMEEGSGREQIIRMVLIVSSTDAVVLKIDPSVVLATREYVDDAIEAHAKSRNHPDATLKEKGLVQLSSATDSTSETLAATPKAVKAAFDNAADKVARAGDTMAGPLGIKSTVTVYEDDVNTVSEFLYSYKEGDQQTKKVGIKAICDADGAGHWVVDVNPAAQGDSRVQAFGIDGKSKIVTTMNGFQLYEGTERVFSKNNPQLMFGVGTGPVDKADAYSNIGQIYRVNATAKNKPPAVIGNVSAGVMCLPMDAAPSAGYFAVVGGSMAAYVGFSQNAGDSITWSRIYTDKYKPTADDMNAVKKTGDTMTGPLTTPYVASTPNVTPEGAGAYANQLNNKAPFYQPNWQWPVDAGGIFVPIAKGTSTRKDQGYPTAVTYGYLMPGTNGFAHPTIHVLGDNDFECIWDFNPQSGAISSKAGMFATQEWVMAQVQNIGQMSVNGTQWWAKVNLNGGTLIVQGGYAEVQDAETTDRIGLNIAVPNRLLGVFITNKNFAQGYATYNPQVTDLTNERDGFNFVHGQKEHMMYWIAVGY